MTSDTSNDHWSWLSRSGLGPVFSLCVILSTPLLFFEKWGLSWFLLIGFLGSGSWWWHNVLNAWEPASLFNERHRKYSWKRIVASALIPVLILAVFAIVLIVGAGNLNVWRRNLDSSTLVKHRYGEANKFFGDASLRETPEEKAEYEIGQWIRWMELGVGSAQMDADLLFVESSEFDKRYHSFFLEAHDLGNQVRPYPDGVAFLVRIDPKDPWRRPSLRQLPCEFASDGDTRLFRVLVENPNPGEKLWLFLPVTRSDTTVKLASLNLQLKVRQ